MAGTNRTTLINKLRNALRKRYKPHAAAADRNILQHLLYACCLENAEHQGADDALAAVSETFFDWNEVRVSTAKELSEVMNQVPDPLAAAQRVRRCLQALFEQTYAFDLETLKKLGLGQAAKRLGDLGATPFAVAYVTQAALGGHAVPTDANALKVLRLLGIVSQKEADAGAASGLERAVPKNKGAEFVSLLQQFAADFASDPYKSEYHQVLLEVAPDVRERLPRKLTKKEIAAEAARKAKEAAEAQRKAKAEEAAREAKKAAAGKAAAAKSKPEAAAAKRQESSPAKAAARPKAPPAKKPAPSAAKRATSNGSPTKRKPR